MNLYLLIAKAVIVIFFLIMFLRKDKLVWGIGLLAVTSAILLDALLETFGREQVQAEFGFFYYIIAGALFAGGAIWLWAVVRPLIVDNQPSTHSPLRQRFHGPAPEARENAGTNSPETAFDRQMLADQMRQRLTPDDLLDLIFDLGWVENDVVGFSKPNYQLIQDIIDLAAIQEESSSLALAVERCLTPIPAENLPRLEKLDQETPRAVLRIYLLANYSQDELAEMAQEMDLDWELLSGENKKAKARNFLIYLIQRNRLPDLIGLMRARTTAVAK